MELLLVGCLVVLALLFYGDVKSRYCSQCKKAGRKSRLGMLFSGPLDDFYFTCPCCGVIDYRRATTPVQEESHFLA